MKPLPAETALSQFYQAELAALRTEAGIFAAQYPDTAAELRMGSGQVLDPHVELLLQSFAFMAGRLRQHVEMDKSRVPNSLAESLYPHLGAPVPSMVMAQASGVAKKAQLQRNQGLAASTMTDTGHAIDCRFRLGCATTLLPLKVTEVCLRAAEDDGQAVRAGAAVVAIRLAQTGNARLEHETLRFFIDTANAADAFQLYELLALHVSRIALKGAAPGAAPARLRWLGFDDAEALLPASAGTPQAYRMLQEYFAFPQKYLMFEVGPLDLGAMSGEAELLLALDLPFERQRRWPAHVLRLNCMPLVNLYTQPIEPVNLDHSQYEYRLVADHARHRYHEIHSIEKLYSAHADGSMRRIMPYFGFDEIEGGRTPDYFYLGRRERSEATGVAGGEYLVSFLDRTLCPTQVAGEVVGGVALCTNRRLPEQLPPGAALALEGPGPAVQLATIGRASPHTMPAQIGHRPWALVSQLALNRLSLAEGPRALRALKEILRLHAGQNRTLALRQIEGVQAIACRHVMRQRRQEGWRGFVRTLRVDVQLDRHAFTDASPVLFWQVLRHFFALYASVNNLVETGFTTNDSSGSDEGWPLLNGAQCVL